ncbi:MAG: transposase family protein [Treponema sp.]|nr:transposase family protein [Treponema sp.]
MSLASVESISDRFNALYDYEVLHMPKTQIAKRYGVCTSTVDGWVERRNFFLKRVKDIVTIVDSGKFNYFFPGDEMEKESEKELQRKIKYLEHKVQYLKALAEVCDIDIANVTKKNATELSDLLSNEKEET